MKADGNYLERMHKAINAILDLRLLRSAEEIRRKLHWMERRLRREQGSVEDGAPNGNCL